MLNQVGKVAAQGAMASLFFGSCLSGRHAGKQVSLSRSRSRSLALSHSLSAVLLMFYYCFTSLLLPLNFTPALFLYYCCTSLLLLLLSLWSPCRQAGDAQGTAARAQDHLSGAPLSSILHVYACVYVRACVRERDRDRETRDYVNANTHTHFLSHTHTQITTEHHVLTKLWQLHNPALLMQEVLAYGCHAGESYILVTGLLGSDLLKLASSQKSARSRSLCPYSRSLLTLGWSAQASDAGTHTCPNVLILAEQALVLLEELHGASYLHRDLKPENLVLGCPGTGVLLMCC